MRLALGLLLIPVCCSAQAPDAPGGGSPPSAYFEPSADPGQVPAVVRIHVRSASLAAGAASLFQGTLSSYYLARIKSGDLPDTLTSRRIPIVSWRANAELIVAPTRALSLGSYSLASASGLVTEFQVSVASPLLKRVWPPSARAAGLAHVVYCGPRGTPLSVDTLSFDPGGAQVAASSGMDDTGFLADRCLHLNASQLTQAKLWVPAPTLGTWAVDPAPFTAQVSDPAVPLACQDGEQAFGFGCAVVEDDRLRVRTPDTALLWIVNTSHGANAEVSEGGGSWVVRGLSPNSAERVWGAVYDLSGAVLDFDFTAHTTAPRARPVLSEVLANPLGPEPRSEWLELANDGAVPVDLSAYTLRDGGGSSVLPPAPLAPGEYVLLARNDFMPGEGDVTPAPGTRVVHVAALGTSGLANSGENLALLDADGAVISALPARATLPGQSLARRHAWSLDADASAFSVGVPTPGVANDLSDAPE